MRRQRYILVLNMVGEGGNLSLVPLPNHKSDDTSYHYRCAAQRIADTTGYVVIIRDNDAGDARTEIVGTFRPRG